MDSVLCGKDWELRRPAKKTDNPLTQWPLEDLSPFLLVSNLRSRDPGKGELVDRSSGGWL